MDLPQGREPIRRRHPNRKFGSIPRRWSLAESRARLATQPFCHSGCMPVGVGLAAR
jgi:hypothetical protein